MDTYERDVEWSDLAHIAVELILTNFPRAKREDASEELAAWAAEAWSLLPEHARVSLRNADLAAGRESIPEEHREVLTGAFVRAAYGNWYAAQPELVRAALEGEINEFTAGQSRALARLRIGQPSGRDQERLLNWFVKSAEIADSLQEVEGPGTVATEHSTVGPKEYQRGLRVDKTGVTENETGFVADEKTLYPDGSVAEEVTIAVGPGGIPETEESNIRAAALVYEAWLLEQAGLFAAADAITQRFVFGTIEVATQGGTGERLASYYWDGQERLNGPDRALLSARLFGGAPAPLASDMQPNNAFDPLFRSLLAVLPGEDPTKVATAFHSLALNVSSASGGYVPFAAERLVHHVATARAIVADRNVRTAFKARNEMVVIQAVTSLDLQTVALLWAKAGAGRRILERIADYAGGAAVPVDSALWRDGIRWLAAPATNRMTQLVPRSSSAVPLDRPVLRTRLSMGRIH